MPLDNIASNDLEAEDAISIEVSNVELAAELLHTLASYMRNQVGVTKADLLNFGQIHYVADMLKCHAAAIEKAVPRISAR